MNLLLNAQTKSTKSLFFIYLVPTLLAVLVKAVLMSVDTVFIGQGIGQLGLAAVGMTMPFNAIFSSLSVFIGIGGAALMSIHFGKKQYQTGQAIFNQALYFLLAISLVLSVAIYLVHQDVAASMGAEGQLAQYVTDYLSITPVFYLLHTLVLILTFFVMNDGNPRLPMFSMLVGIVSCISFDYLFIFEFGWGMEGAALASVITQLLMLSVLFSHFVTKRGLLRLNLPSFKFNYIPEIFTVGLPSLLIELAMTVYIIIFNVVLLNYYSESHVAAFSLVINVTVITALLFGGISQASQPLFSFFHGERKYTQIRELLNWSLLVTLTIATLVTVLGSWQVTAVVGLYAEQSEPFFDLAEIAIGFFILAIPFIGVNMVISGFLQAVKATAPASVISILRGCVFLLIGLGVQLSFPSEHGVWQVTWLAEGATLIISFYLLIRYIKKLGRMELSALEDEQAQVRSS